MKSSTKAILSWHLLLLYILTATNGVVTRCRIAFADVRRKQNFQSVHLRSRLLSVSHSAKSLVVRPIRRKFCILWCPVDLIRERTTTWHATSPTDINGCKLDKYKAGTNEERTKRMPAHSCRTIRGHFCLEKSVSSFVHAKNFPQN